MFLVWKVVYLFSLLSGFLVLFCGVFDFRQAKLFGVAPVFGFFWCLSIEEYMLEVLSSVFQLGTLVKVECRVSLVNDFCLSLGFDVHRERQLYFEFFIFLSSQYLVCINSFRF